MAPMITAWFAESFGLQADMALAVPSFVLAAALWLSLPEMLRRGKG